MSCMTSRREEYTHESSHCVRQICRSRSSDTTGVCQGDDARHDMNIDERAYYKKGRRTRSQIPPTRLSSPLQNPSLSQLSVLCCNLALFNILLLEQAYSYYYTKLVVGMAAPIVNDDACTAFSHLSTAEEVTEGIDASDRTAIVTGNYTLYKSSLMQLMKSAPTIIG